MNKKVIAITFAILSLCIPFFHVKTTKVFADTAYEINYVVYDSNKENILFERVDVKVGDIFIDKNFNQYEIYLVDEREHYAKAEKIKSLKRIGVTKKNVENIANIDENRKIALYMTHNDESYLIGDGTDSFYGAGGIHDVANRLAYELKQHGVNITIDETLHIPHNSSAYSRSSVTAKKLLKSKPNALFDIHRDGVARSAYIENVDGKERCQVRIVVGNANPNKDKNLEFALYLMAVAESVCPWLFCDIYYARGHYNQALYSKALLFEMGTYMVEKDLVMETVPHLANVINTTLFNTSIDKDGNLVIGSGDYSNTINNALNNSVNEKNNNDTFSTIFIILTLLSSAAILIWFFIKIRNEKF